MERFLDKYRIPSARLHHWDYGWNGIYFITICTAGHEHCFGQISGGRMQLSPTGHLAHQFWLEITVHFPFIELDAFVVMPNHVHGILIIDKNDDGRYKQYKRGNTDCRDAIYRVSTPFATTITATTTGGITGAHNPMLHENLSRSIRWYKGRVTFESHRINHAFEWQSRFYDHIIRSDESFNRIREYIESNPGNWDNDQFYN